MSWLQDLAGKAENILNSIDKNAATVLQSTSGGSKTTPATTTSDFNDGDRNSRTPSQTPPLATTTVDIQSEITPSSFKRVNSTHSLRSTQSPNRSHQSSSSSSAKALSLGGSPAAANIPHSKHFPDNDDDAPSAEEQSPSGSSNELLAVEVEQNTSVERQHHQPQPVDTSITMPDDERPKLPHSPAVASSDPAELLHELNALKIVLSQMRDERDGALQRAHRLQRDLLAAQAGHAQLAALDDQCAALRVRCDELTAQCAHRDRENSTHRSEIADLQRRLQHAARTESELQSAVRSGDATAQQAAIELQSYRVRAHDQLRAKEQEIDDLRRGHSGPDRIEAVAARSEREADVVDQSDERQLLEQRISEYRSEIAERKREFDLKAMQTIELEARNDELAARCETSAKQLEAVRSDNRALKEKLAQELAKAAVIIKAK